MNISLFNATKIMQYAGLISWLSIALIPHYSLAQDSKDQAQEADIPNEDNDQTADEIIVTADRIRGSVISEVDPVDVLTADDIASYGANSVQDLLTALAPQTGSARGRSSGPPIVLINAQRASGFRELRNIPPEAIIRVEIFPEEVALQYGFRPDQRVINFILQDNFQSIETSGRFGAATSGGYNNSQNSAGYTKFTKKTRLNLEASYSRTSELTEDERDIIQEDIAPNLTLVGPISAQDIGAFRTLFPETDSFNLSGSYSKSLSKKSRLSFNLAYTHNDSLNLFGLNNPTFTLPATNISNDSGNDILVQRFFTEPRPLQSSNNSDTIQGGAAVNSSIGSWILSSTLDTSYLNGFSRIDQNTDFSALQTQLLNDDGIDLFSAILDPIVGDANFTTARTETFNINNSNTVSGTLFNIPTGEVRTVFSAGYMYNSIDSSSDQSGALIDTFLSRNVFFINNNVDIPITDNGSGIGKLLGKISINGNAGLREVSNFGTLYEYGYGVTWKPFDDLSLSFTAINEEAPPSLSQLGNPIIVTPNIPIFDFTQSQTSFIELTTGGNPNLEAEHRRDIKISLNYSPKKLSGFNLIIDYSRNRSFDTSNSFPLLTPEIEAAFQDRVTRNTNGTLIALDRTPVTFDRVASERIRYGFNFSKRLGPDPRRGAGRGKGRGAGRGGRPATSGRPPSSGERSSVTIGRPNNAPPSTRSTSTGPNNPPQTSPQSSQSRPPNAEISSQKTQGQQAARPQSATPNNAPSSDTRGASPPNASAGPPTGARGRSPRGRGSGAPRRPGRFNISLYHTIALDETILIRPDVTELDLLEGSAIGNNGGAARHLVELEGGIFNNGFGARLSGNFRSASTVNGNILTGSSDLRFGSLATVDIRFFYNLGSKEKITKKLPFLKGTRISLSINNVGNAIQRITDENGDIPRNFQRGFVDPIGRFISFSFRKRF